ncbi:hypothetical protein EDD63_10244 [Breznakia blatticola]|uniref:ABC-2 family transporter n=1 Tax=Breznakia blatticola TaxID=1754012 RepID=A0A4R8A5V3_9FIRM|nr:hypothetical protein [Breznakia blatticola]TDW26023.1 hypothetical protein EDD63_10244 [Breznakia blatticola]
MKLVFYELKKIISKKSFLMCLILCVVFLIFFAFSTSSSTNIYSYHKQYNEMLLNSPSYEETYQKLVTLEKDLQNSLQTNSENEIPTSANENTVNNRYGISDEEAYILVSDALHYVENIGNYEKYQSGIIQSDLEQQTKASYENIEKDNVKIVNYLAIEASSKQYIVFVLAVFVSIYAIYILNNFEQESNTAGISYLSKKGKFSLYKAKFLAISCISISTIIVFCVFLLVINSIIYGLPDMLANIQSIPIFYESPYNISILAGIFLCVGKQIFLIIGFISVYYLLLSLLRSDLRTSIVICLFCLLEFFFLQALSDYSSLSILRKWNIFNLAYFETLINEFGMQSLFGIQMKEWQIFILCMIILLVVTMSAIYVYSKGWINSTKTITRHKPNTRGKHVSLKNHEFYKQFINGKGLFIIIVSICFCLYISYGFFDKMNQVNFSSAEEQYQIYGGNLSNKKIKKIEEKKTAIENESIMFQKSSSDYEKGLLTHEEFQQIEDAYIFSLMENRAFENFYSDYSNIIGTTIVYPTGYQAVFSLNTYSRDMMYGTWFVLIAVLLFSGLYSIDKSAKQENLYKLTLYGKKRRLDTQRRIGYLESLIIAFLLFCISFVLFVLKYPMSGWLNDTISIFRLDTTVKIYDPMYLQVPLLINFLYLQIFRLLVLFTVLEIVLVFSQVLRSRKNTITIMFILVLLPFMLAQIGLEGFQYISLIHLLSGNIILHTSIFGIGGMYLIAYVLIRIISFKLAQKNYSL